MATWIPGPWTRQKFSRTPAPQRPTAATVTPPDFAAMPKTAIIDYCAEHHGTYLSNRRPHANLVAEAQRLTTTPAPPPTHTP